MPPPTMSDQDLAGLGSFLRRAQGPVVGQAIGLGTTGQPVDLRPRGLWARLTGPRAGNRYAWVRAVPNADGTVPDDGASPNREQGTVATWPAVEVNRNGGINPGTVVWLEPDPFNRPHFAFGHCCDDGYGYPYGSGPYGLRGGVGSVVSWTAVTHVRCDPASGAVLFDRVRYQELLLGGRLSLSVEPLPADTLPTACVQVLTDYDFTITMSCVNNAPVATVTKTKTYDRVRVIACGTCPPP